MIRQVRIQEKFMDGQIEKSRRVFGFGTHELADDIEIASTRPAGMVTTAAAFSGITGNKMRVIVDELLIGNNIEEIACRANPPDAVSRVPLNATPEDIARCASADDVLPQTCPASNPRSVCICKNPNGCTITGTGKQVAQGMPIGVLDIDQDGAADETRMIPGVVQIRCGTNISVPIDLDNSYWNPSGDQNRPAQGGFEALGPAIVVVPLGPLPTNLECQLAFADGSDKFPDAANGGAPLAAITDKQGENLCTPPNGDVAQSCTPGDTSAFKFKVEPFKLIADTTVFEGATGINRNISAVVGSGGQPIDIVFNVPVSPTSLGGITFSPALPAGATLMIIGTNNNARTVRVSGPNPLQANTEYTLTVTNAVTDTFDQPLTTPVVIHFTTGA